MHDKISKLIGEKFIFRGEVWIMVEVLISDDAIVITPEKKQLDTKKKIQADQYGQARRRCPECLTLELSNAAGDNYSEVVLEFLSGHFTK